jgi:hypothetical protein
VRLADDDDELEYAWQVAHLLQDDIMRLTFERDFARKKLEKQEAEIAKLEKALTLIRYINHGPDRASGEWRCMEAAQIARNALEEISLEERVEFET